MKRIGVILCLLTFCVRAQNVNIIPNYSFEELYKCTIGYNYPDLKNWYNPNSLSPDAFLYCMDSVIPNTLNSHKRHTGLNRVGIIAYNEAFSSDGGEYLANKLIDSLKQNVNYCFDFFAIPAKNFKYGMDRLGIYFGTGNQYYATALIPQTPQLTTPTGMFINDTSKWSHFELIYVATGNETDIVIGNFYGLANTNVQVIDTSANSLKKVYLVIDDVSLHEMSINSGNDAVTCPQNMVATIGETNLDTAFKSYYWYDASGVLIDSINSQITVQPTNSTFYIEEKRMCGQSLWDTVYVNIINECPPEPEIELIIPNVFSPNDDFINDTWQVSTTLNLTIALSNYKVEIFNRYGVKMFESNSPKEAWTGRTTSGVKCSEGVYYYVIEFTNSKEEKETHRGYISLFR